MADGEIKNPWNAEIGCAFVQHLIQAEMPKRCLVVWVVGWFVVATFEMSKAQSCNFIQGPA
tara:strand:- start:1 stop:183 length:183 start_codon:yes stop_codon:yes gene_type:complete